MLIQLLKLNNQILISTLAKSFINVRNSTQLIAGKSDELYYANDTHVVTSFVKYGLPQFDALLDYLQPLVESVTGKELWPTYSYARIYYPNSELAYHTDRYSCEYSMTLTLQSDSVHWPIWLLDRQGTNKEVILPVGTGCIYAGIELPHWRSRFAGTQHIQVFLHYVDKNGKQFVEDIPILGIQHQIIRTLFEYCYMNLSITDIK